MQTPLIMTKSIGIALIGAGIFAKAQYLQALMKLSDSGSAKLCYIYSRSEASAISLLHDWQKKLPQSATEAVSGDEGLARLLADPLVDAVCIVLPIPNQPEVAKKCLEAGKHVLIEKPIATDSTEARELIKTAERQTGVFFGVAENYRFEDAFTYARTKIASGEIGDVFSFTMNAIFAQNKENKYYKTEWRQTPQYQGGFLLDGGIHIVGMMRYLLSAQLHVVATKCRQIQPFLPPMDTVNTLVAANMEASVDDYINDQRQETIETSEMADQSTTDDVAESPVGNLIITFAGSHRSLEMTILGTRGRVTVRKVDESYEVSIDTLDKVSTDVQKYSSRSVECEVAAFIKSIQRGILDERLSAREALADLIALEGIIHDESMDEN